MVLSGISGDSGDFSRLAYTHLKKLKLNSKKGARPSAYKISYKIPGV